MDNQEAEQKFNIENGAVEFAKFVLSAMHKQRDRDARLIREYADQLPDGHPARPYLYEVSDTLLRQSIE